MKKAIKKDKKFELGILLLFLLIIYYTLKYTLKLVFMKYSFEKKIIAPEIISAEIEKLTENKFWFLAMVVLIYFTMDI